MDEMEKASAGQGLRALDGIKVFEFGIGVAAPFIGRNLAAHGADVYKIESPTSPDIVRVNGSAWFRDREDLAEAVQDSSPTIAEMNADKLSVAIDMKSAAGIDAARRLIGECDVFLSNFRANVLVELGLDYESVTSIKPDIVYVELPGFGSDPEAPYYPYIAWGPNQSPLVGIDELTGYPGAEPAGVATVALPDYNSALHGAFCVLAGLEHRDKTGQSVHVDVSQFDATVALLGPFTMEVDLAGRGQSRIGNRSLWFAPQGVYPCAGDERWIAISCEDDDQWTALDALADRGWGTDQRYSDLARRMENLDVLDAAVAEWTSGFSSAELAHRLQAQGVAAHIVATNEDVIADDQMRERRSFLARPSARFKRDIFTATMHRLTSTPPQNLRGAPSMGEHTLEVLTEVAGLSGSEVESLFESGAAFAMSAPDLRLERPSEEWLHVLFPSEAEDSRDLA